MKIALIGRTAMLLEAGRRLVEAGHEVAAVITAKAAPEYSVVETDFQTFANEINAPFVCTSAIMDAADIISSACNIDLAVSVNYVGVIPQAFIDLFPIGILNAHGGDLPRYRGNACQAWAILMGEPRIGLCVHKMVGGELDAGDIVARDFMFLDESTYIGDCLDWMEQRVPALFLDAVYRLDADRGYILESQDDAVTLPLRCYPRRPEDGFIDWQQDAEDIARLVRASSLPFVGAVSRYRGELCFIGRAVAKCMDEQYLAVPGQVLLVDDNNEVVWIACGKGCLLVEKLIVGGDLVPPTSVVRGIRNRMTNPTSDDIARLSGGMP